ncbi:profilin-like [Salvia divinorum]|uniref:Pollen allergen Ole e 2 n=1 Tax=Salvia divinorum TaxID=28513 RepID=A0ABD1FZQ4_SALDI
MRLQSYIDEQFRSDADSHFLDPIAIVGHDGTVLAQTFSFPKLKPNEITSIMNEFDNPGSLAATGLHIGETKYT